MHEYALAEGIISTAIKAAINGNLKRITEVKIKIGELQQIDSEVFTFVIKEIIKNENPIIKDARIVIEQEKAVLKCSVCESAWNFSEINNRLNRNELESIHFVPEVSHTFIRCPRCKSPDFKVVCGNRGWVDSVEGEE
ncbi:MAG: hydrogenase nickel insertion protein HypA [Elusimicrobia bacterium RIFOXYD2_FULL_34_15]|nr:MAG: hydrogenase nickel insertion protein HypA [Elusimicrobia bacterium RIFOXYD2_FULL_34_15]